MLTLASRELVTVSPENTVLEAMHLIVGEGVEHLPVLDEGRLVGICARTDLLRARLQQLEEEVPQSGWRPPTVRRPSAADRSG